MMPCAALTERWRTQATELRLYGAVGQATALEACADQLEATERVYLFEELTVQEAADELGVSYETIGRRLRRGDVLNAGEKNRPRVRRIDLAARAEASSPCPVTDHGEPDIADKVLRSGT